MQQCRRWEVRSQLGITESIERSLRMNTNISFEELRRRICTKYDVEELCDIMELTPEDIFDQMFDRSKHIELFEDVLTELDYDLDG
jgi:DNA-binding Xre family transcriptional regulator